MRKLEAEAKMTEDACRLDSAQRALVEDTVRDHCRIRNWSLRAVNCRTNHVHVVVTADVHPDSVREQLKAWCTRRLKGLARSNTQQSVRRNWWAERGSRRYINDAESLEAAILYVLNGQ